MRDEQVVRLAETLGVLFEVKDLPSERVPADDHLWGNRELGPWVLVRMSIVRGPLDVIVYAKIKSRSDVDVLEMKIELLNEYTNGMRPIVQEGVCLACGQVDHDMREGSLYHPFVPIRP